MLFFYSQSNFAEPRLNEDKKVDIFYKQTYKVILFYNTRNHQLADNNFG